MISHFNLLFFMLLLFISHAETDRFTGISLTICRKRLKTFLFDGGSCEFGYYIISLLCGAISVKLAGIIRHVSWYCQEGFQGQRSKVKVIAMHFSRGGISVNGSSLKTILFEI